MSSRLPKHALIGVIHLPALPGSHSADLSLERIIGQVRREATLLQQHGFDALVVENFGDAPFKADVVEPHTVALMSRCVAVAVACGIPIGVNVLRNDARAALAVAAASGAEFVRVNVHSGVYATDQGIIEGQAEQTLQYRRRICPEVAIFADVHVKHAQPMSQPDIGLAAEETALRGGADVLIVSGTTTGRQAAWDDIGRVKQAVPDRPVLVGSGVTPANVRQTLEHCDGVIVGSCLKQDGKAGQPLDDKRVREFVQAARKTA